MAITPRIRTEDTFVTLADGTKLATDVTVPDDGAQYPVLLIRTPYGRAGVRQMHDPIALARGGWAVVNQDVRGRWDSSGTFENFHPEIADGSDAVKWCVEQPWSNGKVAMTGASYIGATQFLAALGRPKGLLAISPTVSSAQYREHWSYEGGMYSLGFLETWALGLAAGGNKLGRAKEREALKLVSRQFDKTLRLPLQDGPVGKLFPPFEHWIRYDDDAYWKPIDVQRRLSSLHVAGYHVAGWYDIFCEGSIKAYTELATNARDDYVRASQRLVIGPWTHASVYLSGTGHASFGIEADGLYRNIPGKQLAFLRSALERREVESGVDAFVIGPNRWIEFPSWPPPATETSLYLDGERANSLAGDGRLSFSPPEHAGVDTYRHDPDDPVPTNGGRTLIGALPEAGQLDQRQIEERGDVLVYTSEPLKRELTVIGLVRAEIAFESSAPRADVVAKLVDVTPTGEALNILDAGHRVELTPGRVRTVSVDVGSIAVTFRRGHRIRLELASSNFPRFDRLEAADQKVRRGGRAASRLILPVYTGKV